MDPESFKIVAGEKYPKISVVTPNFNCVKYLERTLLSVINQGYPNLEYIVIDGGSNDGSVDIIKKYEEHLFFWVSEKDGGLYHALNKGFSKASGDILMYINSDDFLFAGSLKLIGKSFLNNPEILWLTGYYAWLNEDDEITRIEKNKNWSIIDYINGDFQWIQQESTVWRKEAWIRAGGKFDTSFKYAADMALWCNFFMQGNPVIADFNIGAFRIRRNQLSQENLGVYNEEAKIAITNLRKNSAKAVLKDAKKVRRLNYLIRFLKKSILLDNNWILNLIENQKTRLKRNSFRLVYQNNHWHKTLH